MLKELLGRKETTKVDVFMAVAAVITGAWQAFDKIRDYKAEHNNKEINK